MRFVRSIDGTMSGKTKDSSRVHATGFRVALPASTHIDGAGLRELSS